MRGRTFPGAMRLGAPRSATALPPTGAWLPMGGEGALSGRAVWRLHAARCDSLAARYGLSPRERDVLYLLARGRSIDYIAQDLSISFNTAKSHIRHIYVKADIHSRQELLDLMDSEIDLA